MTLDNDILTMAALVTALVGITKGYGIDTKHSHVLALFFAAIFVLVPDIVREKFTLIAIIGLTASGAYQYTKNKRKEGE